MSSTQDSYYDSRDAGKNGPNNHLPYLIRTRSDALRMAAPVRDWCELADMEDEGEKLEAILRLWDSPQFKKKAPRAIKILTKLGDYWEEGNGVDMLDLGERRLIINALADAIADNS